MPAPLSSFDFSVLDDPEFKEDSVREEIVAPVLKALGYSASGDARIVRSRALQHPFVQFGVTKKRISIVPDYLLEVNGVPRWVVDAKAPWESVDNPDHVAQAYSYAVHREVRAHWYALCNGHELVVYNTADLKPRLRVSLPELSERWQEVLRLLFPPAMTHAPGTSFFKDFGLHLMRLGFNEGTEFAFPGIPVRTVAKTTEQTLTGFGMNVHSEGEEYAVSFDFSLGRLEELLTALPRGVARDLKKRLRRRSPVIVYLTDPYPAVTVWARLCTKPIENKKEIYLPLEIIRFSPASHGPEPVEADP